MPCNVECEKRAFLRRCGWSRRLSSSAPTSSRHVTTPSLGRMCNKTRTWSPFSTTVGQSIGKKRFLRLMGFVASGELDMQMLFESCAENHPPIPCRVPPLVVAM
jgi:hypothetical protein